MNDHIPSEKIKQDIADTQAEIDQYQREAIVLVENRTENRVPLYIIEGRIQQRVEFISKLNKILEDR